MVWFPGSDLLRQAWDATKLAGAIRETRRQAHNKAVILQKNQVVSYRGPKANAQMVKLFENKEYKELAELWIPSPVVNYLFHLRDFFMDITEVYWICLALRIILIFFSFGYVHPDEHFQSLEVVTGDVLGVHVTRTWEFNSTSPIRSMTIPLILFGSPLWFINKIASFLINSYTVLIIPRLIMLILSFITDYAVYQICRLYKHDYNICLKALSSSYVMLIYSTKTLSNSIELAILSTLIYWIMHCMKRTEETIFIKSMIRDASKEASSIAERVRINKKHKIIPQHDFKYFGRISILCAIGVTNRPTFVIFACIPLFFWFQRNVSYSSYWTPFQTFNFRMISLLPGFILSALALLLSDSLYYGDLTLSKLKDMNMSWSDWKCTPLNFVLYNAVPGNLDKHGSHPLWLHSFVNIPLLFGPLGIFALFGALEFVAEVISNEWKAKPGLRTPYALTMGTFCVSLGLLSIFPHQEPRFLIPLILPTVLMNAHKLNYLIGKKRPLLTAWYIFNAIMTIFYGFVHQGAVYTAVSNVKSLESASIGCNILFARTYMPPTYPILRKDLRIQVTDFAGKPLDSLKTKAEELTKKSEVNYLVIPTSSVSELKGLKLKHLNTYWPHLSTEYPPNIIDTIYDIDWKEFSPYNVLISSLSKISELSLSVYEIESV